MRVPASPSCQISEDSLMDLSDDSAEPAVSLIGALRAGLSRRLAVEDGSLAGARDLRRWVRALGLSAPARLRRAAAFSVLLPPLGVRLARVELGAFVPDAVVAEDLGSDTGADSVLVITPSADQATAAACASALPAAPVTFVGDVRPRSLLAAALGPRRPLRRTDVTSALSSASACARVSFHGLDIGALEAAAGAFGFAAQLDLNAMPSPRLPSPAAPGLCEWTEAGLLAAVAAIETPKPAGDPGCFVRSPRRFSHGRGRSYLRLAAGADPAECARALDCLVAMRHVWIVSVDPSHDPRLIERVARDAAFCEEQTEDVFLDFVTDGDVVRVIGSCPVAAPTGARFVTGPLAAAPEDELRLHYHRQLLRVGLPSPVRPERLA